MFHSSTVSRFSKSDAVLWERFAAAVNEEGAAAEAGVVEDVAAAVEKVAVAKAFAERFESAEDIISAKGVAG